jgi:putative membrane protein
MNIANTAVTIVGGIHLVIAIGEIFLWKEKKVGRRLKQGLGLDEQTATNVAPIVANAGLYNAIVGAGLILAAISSNHSFAIFFLSCVAIAGVFGAITLKQPAILLLQTLPAVIAGMCLIFQG